MVPLPVDPLIQVIELHPGFGAKITVQLLLGDTLEVVVVVVVIVVVVVVLVVVAVVESCEAMQANHVQHHTNAVGPRAKARGFAAVVLGAVVVVAIKKK